MGVFKDLLSFSPALLVQGLPACVSSGPTGCVSQGQENAGIWDLWGSRLGQEGLEEQQIRACSGHPLGKAPPDTSELGAKGTQTQLPPQGKVCSLLEGPCCHPRLCFSPGFALLEEFP